MKYLVLFLTFVFVSCIATISYLTIDLNKHTKITFVKIRTKITGAISKPDTYFIKSKSTLFDLINLAGGLTINAKTEKLNFDEILKPDQTYYIPYAVNHIHKLNINAFSSSTKLINTIKTIKLKTKIADSIIHYIKVYGNFTNWKEIDNIEGVGEKLLAELKKYLFIA